MLPIEMREHDFQFGPFQIPFDNVLAAGVALKRRKVGTFRSLLIAYRLPGDAKVRRINFALDGSPGHLKLVESMRARSASRWKGEAEYFALRKAMGLPNGPVFMVVAALVVLAVVITVGLLVLGPKHSTGGAAPAKVLPRGR